MFINMVTKKVSKVSIVLPIYNEEKNILGLYKELKQVLVKLGKDYEIIFVDDSSKDNSLDILSKLYEKDEKIQVISLMGNQGQTTALNAGFKNASGDVIIAMDGDGQHNPEYIPVFVKGIEDGYDLVSGWKKEDKSRHFIYKFLSKIAHKTICMISKTKLKYFGATMKAYDSKLLKKLDLSGDLHRFAGALVSFKGIKIKEIPLKIRANKKRKSNYSLIKIPKVALDLFLMNFLVKYAKTPFRFFGFFGFLFNILGLMGLSCVFIQKQFFGKSTQENVSLIMVSALLIMVGIQFLFFGLISELISRIYYTSNNKQYYQKRVHLKHREKVKK